MPRFLRTLLLLVVRILVVITANSKNKSSWWREGQAGRIKWWVKVGKSAEPDSAI